MLHRFRKYLHIPMYLGMERPRGKKTQNKKTELKQSIQEIMTWTGKTEEEKTTV